MPIKRVYSFISSALIVLPFLVLLINWERLPDQLPLHFDPSGQADQLGTREQWLTSISWPILSLGAIRIIFLQLISRQSDLSHSRLVSLYLSTAVLLAGAVLLLIGQGIWKKPLYQEWLPMLFYLFGSCFVYYGVSPNLSATDSNEKQDSRSFAIRERVHSLTRLVTIRVNILAVLIMWFAQVQDRWLVGILANLLVYGFITGYAFYLRRPFNNV